MTSSSLPESLYLSPTVLETCTKSGRRIVLITDVSCFGNAHAQAVLVKTQTSYELDRF